METLRFVVKNHDKNSILHSHILEQQKPLLYNDYILPKAIFE